MVSLHRPSGWNNSTVKRSHFLGYGIAVLAVAIALMVTLLLKPLLDHTPTLPFFAAVIFSAWYGGFFASLTAAILSTLAINYYFLDPINSLHFTGWSGFLVALNFLTVAVFTSWLNASRKQAEEALQATLEQLKTRTKQQEAIALLGRKALAGADLSTLMDETVTLIAETLEAEYCKVLELLPDGRALLLRAGIGWHEGLVGNATVGTELDSQAGYTLLSAQPVIVADLRAETRFSGPPLLHEHGVISGISVIIAGQNRPWGVLGAHTTQLRIFTTDDINFFQAAANILAATIERQQAEGERDQLLEQEQAARAMAEVNEQNYRFLAETIPQIVWTSLPDGFLDYYNQRWFDYTGMTLEQTQGWGWERVLHPDDVQPCLDAWSRAIATGDSYEIEYRFLRALDGSYRWHLGRALPLRDKEGRIVKWFGTCTDIDDQKQAQAERGLLLEREQAVRSLVEQSAERVHCLQMIADAAIAPLALDDLLSELLNRITAILHVDTAAILLAEADGTLVVKAAKGFEGELQNSVRIPPGMGLAGRIARDRLPLLIERDAYTLAYSPVLREKRIQSLMGAPLLVDGRVLGVVHVGTVEVRQFSYEDLQLLQLASDRVAMAIDRANLYEAELKARQQAEAANRIKDEFLAIVSHELRTPLNSILGWAQILRTRQMNNEAMATKGLEAIERNAKLQTKLIDDILDVSRIIRGKIRLQVHPIDLASIIQEAVETHLPAAKAKNIKIEFLEADCPIPVLGDRDRLQQIVGNLLSNAIKFTPQGGEVEVRLDADLGNYGTEHLATNSESLGLIPEGDRGKDHRKLQYALIAVKDTGIGIGPEFLPHVFEGFRQADGSITRAHGGLGLGLTIARYLTELHGGTIEATSGGISEGAIFTVKLPLVHKVSDRALETQPQAKALGVYSNITLPVPLAGVRILVVDDDADTCELIATVLAQYGALVKTAASAKLALESMERVTPDVLVSDIGMPGENGYELIRKVRQLEAQRGGYIPAIALTAYAREEDRRLAMQAGFQLHFPKPIEPDKLASVLADLAGQT